ncbi:hypothetical protein SUDANB6_04038 [Streptomyces sp. enrichment culture]|uniref:hypothetical protein n=1 Tax=Streptomyces sp. enrichment culture TaxID=1795815 RepID=UPI003F573346
MQAAGHAEEGILNGPASDEHAIFGATTISFCNATCFPLMNVRGMTLAGGFGHKPHNSPFGLFWLSEEDQSGCSRVCARGDFCGEGIRRGRQLAVIIWEWP